jgi:hypothetical protein
MSGLGFFVRTGNILTEIGLGDPLIPIKVIGESDFVTSYLSLAGQGMRAESLVQTLRRKLSGYRAKTHKLDVCTNLVHFFT